ncbi:MAG TPA: vitamin B12 dependent-methionine synthase activation domain-containing protein, partial [Acidobacteriota bacterium]|nr:vitamin B12 dependent-methionine synthase activation domain-containing protein [Acidobacteriota bacterium]
LVQSFGDQARALIDGGVDYLLLETGQDMRNIKAGLIGIWDAFKILNREVPVAVSVTIEPMGTMLAGQNAEAIVASLEHADLLYLGLNCATGPEFMTDHLRTISELAQTFVACVPNAGLPDEEGHYLETPAMVANVLNRFIAEGWVNLIGGCCGTTPAHIEAMVRLASGRPPRPVPRHDRVFVSGTDALEIEESVRPVLVGERTNVLGSRLFKRLIAEGKYDEASEIARRQVKNGAHIIDVCLQDPDRDEAEDMRKFLDQVVRKVRVPLMIDTTDPEVMEEALTYCQGKSILNSINLEDGEERFKKVVPLARKYGAAVIVGTIDEDKQRGMAVTRERKLEIALRSYDLLVNRYGLKPTAIIFDALVFPCATGDENYRGSAPETIEGVRLIKQALPQVKTILGISNVSFGLPPAGREIVNSVFLYHATKAGLDMAIVNSEKIERYASIPEKERQLAEDVLFRTNDQTIAAFAAHFRDAADRRTPQTADLPLDQRLANYIVEGTKDGLIEDLDLKLREMSPLDIINGPLMKGMDEVGRLFNNNELIVAEVLQSAEAMKAAVAYLEQFMDRSETGGKGVVILATVKGDVHDIGKNLVDIILSNNGYKVINLGIKVPPHDLIQAVREHRPDVIGLSGLLVKSAQQMAVTAAELSKANISVPLMVGGAALSRRFTRLRIAPEYTGPVVYARDAMEGLELAARLLDPVRRRELEQQLCQEQLTLTQTKKAASEPAPAPVLKSVDLLESVPSPPDFDRHVLNGISPDEVWKYLNPSMLLGKHMGLKGRIRQKIEEGDQKARMLLELFEELKSECRQGAMQIHAVWQFFVAQSSGNCIRLYHPDGRLAEEFEFPRQADGQRLCLADYVWGEDRPLQDSVCLFAVSAGKGIREVADRYREQGQFLKSHGIQALALESAEAAAEWLHSKLRGLWGFPDSPEMTIREKLQAQYRGKRYSFGYPACPALEDQAKLWRLIRPDLIGIELTEGFMMEPEASVSAMVFHHPQAKYFSAEVT